MSTDAPRRRPSRTTVVAIAIALAAAIGITLVALDPFGWSSNGESVSVHVHEEGENIYTCPMHPQVVQEGPGVCPICHMDLVPKTTVSSTAEEDHGLAPAVVQLSERGRVVADVATTRLTSRPFAAIIEATANVDYNEATHRVVTSRIAGRVERFNVDQTGSWVSKAMPLMEIYSPELVAAQQEYLVAREAGELELPTLQIGEGKEGSPAPKGSGRFVETARRKLELLGMTAGQINALARRGRVSTTTTVFSPFSGIVLKRGVTDGSWVNTGSLILELVDLSSVYVIANVLEADAWRVRPGQQIQVRGEALGGEILTGRVDYVYPSVDPASRTVRVRAVMPNPGLRLKPGMYVTARILAPQGEALALPASAVIRTGKRDIVYIEVGPRTYEPRQVKVGVRDGAWYEVVDGITTDDRVVVEGGYLIDAESRLSSPAEGDPHAAHGGEK